ncbi:FHA domain-containing protein [Trichocoleus sp. DQ-A3]|uniref:FHA domain-containing protein n=1 Tax=Cyanophyceae TaxID=3028117 RepID=UPI00168A316D|nr:FHA domain-containing protein [Coleofasciculus sp. FACHB-125]
MITLTLLHPIQSIPVQNWTFEPESVVIRIGRSTENDVILYSAVVSRHHVEIRRSASDWEVVSLGANGTYLDGKRIDQVPVVDGMIIRLASSGPQIQIRIGSAETKARLNTVAGKQSVTRKFEEKSRDRETFIDARSLEPDEKNQPNVKLVAALENLGKSKKLP